MFTTAHHLSPYWARLIHSIPSHHTAWRSLWISSSHLLLGPPNCLLWFPHQNPICISPMPCMCHMPSAHHPFGFDDLNNMWWGAQSMQLFNIKFFQSPVTASCLVPNILLNTPHSNSLLHNSTSDNYTHKHSFAASGLACSWRLFFFQTKLIQSVWPWWHRHRRWRS